ncbi:MAG: FtsK/SpoIIIE domain-containing protein [Acidimicrobiales bacterium]
MSPDTHETHHITGTTGTHDGHRTTRWVVTWTAGPDAGASIPLPPGDHLVGRSPRAAVRCDDPSLEPFHLRLHLPATADPSAPLGGASWCQLAGRRPVVHEADDALAVGAGVLRVTPADPATISTDTADTADTATARTPGAVVVRRPRHRPEPVPVPAAPTEMWWDHAPARATELDVVPGGMGTAVGSLAVGVVLAVVLHQVLVLVMGAVGAVVAVGTQVAARVRRARRRRQLRREAAAAAVASAEALDRRRAELEQAHRAAHPGLVDALRLTHHDPQASWYRRPDHGDAFAAVIGVGAQEVPAGGDGVLVLERVPVLVGLDPGARVAVGGPWGDAVARSVVVQLAATTGPADWQLVVVSERPAAWAWIRGLPHLRTAPGGEPVHDEAATIELLAALPALDGRHLVVLTDDVERLAVRTSALRRLLHVRADLALLVHLTDARLAPAVCERVWSATTDGRLRDLAPTGGRADAAHPRLVGLGARSAAAAVRACEGRRDPEAPDDHERGLPTVVSLDALWAERGAPVTRDAIARRWRAPGADDAAAPIGVAVDGMIDLDLVRDGPHGLIAGTTGSGKSELLRTFVLSSAIAQPPDRLSFVLVDFKGGATFDDLTRLPHVAGVVTDLEPRLAERVLRGLRAEVTRREHVLRELGCADLAAARRRTGASVAPRLVVVVDEFAALALEHAALLHALVDVARRGRSLGVHLVLATQRPAGVVSEEIRTNTDLRIALRLHDASEAHDVVGDPSPAALRRSCAGRAVLRLGPGDLVTFQTARPDDVTRAIDEVVAATGELGLGRAPRPWCEPLPAHLTGLPIDVLGRIDRPDDQHQDDFAWEPTEGHLLVVGAPGSGVTTALAGCALRRLGPDDELVVIDAVGDRRWSSAVGHPRLAGVARLHERELVDRALRRAIAPVTTGRRLVVIDGLTSLRRELEAVSRIESHTVFEALLASPPVGVTLLLGNDALGGLGPGVLARCGRRLVLHLHDPAEAGLVGRRAVDVPDAVPGRALDASNGDEVQLAPWPEQVLAPCDGATATRHGPAVEPLGVLPDAVPSTVVPRSAADAHGWQVVVGLAYDDLRPAVLEVPDGEHVLVIGPPRSGRSEVLDGFRRCWSDARPDAAQVVVAGRRLPRGQLAGVVTEALDQTERALADGRHVLLAIDDVEQVPDPEGRLACWATHPPAGLVIVASARPDTVRTGHAHWAAGLRRHRRGVVLAGCDELDAELLGARLPRHQPLPARPGLCWLVGDGATRLAQAAT